MNPGECAISWLCALEQVSFPALSLGFLICKMEMLSVFPPAQRPLRVKGMKSCGKCFCELQKALKEASANSVNLGKNLVQRLLSATECAETLANVI